MTKRIFRLVWINALMAAVPVFAYIFFNPDPDFHRAAVFYQYSFVYANCIGILSGSVLPGLGCWVNRFRPWPRWGIILGILTLIATVGSLSAAGILKMIGLYENVTYFQAAWTGGKMGLILTLIFGVSTLFLHSYREKLEETTLQLRTRELEKERALKLASEAQLQSLEARIHPHFLFNALNSVSSLIQEDPELAERQIERISRFLRFSLDRASARLVPLSEEMRTVADYLEIERTRFGWRLRYSIDVEPGVEATMIPPMAVQTLVENSVKYAIAPRRRGGEIRISAGMREGKLSVQVWDDGPGFSPALRQEGHGLSLLERRLEALFGETAAVAFSNGTGMKVAIEVPCARS